jgi:FHS family L-fucose permease-like MFS transporter
MLVQSVFFAAYALVGIPAGHLTRKIGYKRGIIVGLAGAGVGCVLFYPAAGARSFSMFLGALFVLASGITVLQVAANPYVAILGRPQTASARLNLTQAFNSLGTTVAPYFGAALILSHAVRPAEEIAAMPAAEAVAYRASEAAAVQVPYIGLGLVLFAIAVVVARLKLPSIEAPTGVAASDDAGEVEAERASAWAYRHLRLGAIAIFVYVGAEVAIGSFLINYLGEDFVAGMEEATAGRYLMFYWGGAMVGRFVGSAVLRYASPGRVLGINAVVAAGLVGLTIVSEGDLAMWSILAVGLFNSIMFPTIFTLALRGLGRHTGVGSGILCAAIVGGAIVPLLQGILADNLGIQLAFILPVACYLFIAHYGFLGSRPERHGPI